MNLGDIVRVKDYMKEGLCEGIYYNQKMDRYKGKTYMITHISKGAGPTIFSLGNLDKTINENLYHWAWVEKWLEPVNRRDGIEAML